MTEVEKSPSERLAQTVAMQGRSLLAASEETDRLVAEAAELGLRSAVRKINDSFDVEIEKLKGSHPSSVTEEEMFKQVQSEENSMVHETEVNRQRFEFVTGQILKNRKFSDSFKSTFEASNYQNIQNLNYLNNLKNVK
jgi:hypothetical protein